MSDQSNAYAVVIADLKRQRDEIDRMIARLEAMAKGQPVAGGAAAPKAEAKVEDQRQPAAEESSGDSPFLGMSIVDAVKAVLAKKRRPMNPAELVDALESGGLMLSGENKGNTVGSVLNRRMKQVGDVVNPKRGQWGLKEWYPGRTFVKKVPGESGDKDRIEDALGATATSEPEQPSEQPPVFHLRSVDRP